MKRGVLLASILAIFIFGLLAVSRPSSAVGTEQAETEQQNELASRNELPAIIDANADSEEENDPDLPKGRSSNIDEAAYLRLRGEYIARLRGVEPGRPFDPGARGRAVQQMNQVEKQRVDQLKGSYFNKLTSAFGSESPLANFWAELGPRPIPNGSGQGASTIAVTGRVTSIAVDPTNANKVYLGTAQGGVWRSLDAGVNWTPIFDSAQSLAIGALAIAPSSPSTLFVGTGEFNGCGDCFFGVGLYRIDNADTSATLVGPINPQQTISNFTYRVFNGRGITKILVHPSNPDIVFVSTGRGVSGSGANALSTTPDLGGTLATRGLYRTSNA
ncbi:MAG TPA: hypothetical protein VJT50_06275, partial [Pyrinomonadaceae bacterium]|nr:hypothetical protein [Pyrinomonadaceae bacterium]